MSLRGVEITEGKIGANTATDGREFALVAGGVAVADKLTIGEIYELKRPSDAVAIGIDSKYDVTNTCQVYRHISEFYRIAGEGKPLIVCVVALGTTPADMVAKAKEIILERDIISDIAFAYNPAANYVSTLLNGMDSNVYAGIKAMNDLAIWADENDRPVHCLLEGRGLGDTISSVADLRALTLDGNDYSAEKVTFVSGQDWKYADGLDAVGKKFADVGTYLGCAAAQAWNRNPGEVGTMVLTNTDLEKWLIGGLSNHKKYTEVYADLETLDGKGYVFPIKYTGMSGYWWNNGHTCAPIVMDAAGNMNQHTIYYSHTFNMAKRALRIAYLPEVKKVQELESGKLGNSLVAYYNQVGDSAFDTLAAKGLISGGETNTSADSDLLIAKQLDVEFGVVPTGCVDVIKGTLNLKNS